MSVISRQREPSGIRVFWRASFVQNPRASCCINTNKTFRRNLVLIVECCHRSLVWFSFGVTSRTERSFESVYILRGRQKVSLVRRLNHDSRFLVFWSDDISRDTACNWFIFTCVQACIFPAKTKDFKVKFIPWHVIIYMCWIGCRTVVSYKSTNTRSGDFDRPSEHWLWCLSIIPCVSIVLVACMAGRNYNRDIIMNYARDRIASIRRLSAFAVLHFSVNAWIAFIYFSWRLEKTRILCIRKIIVKWM